MDLSDRRLAIFAVIVLVVISIFLFHRIDHTPPEIEKKLLSMSEISRLKEPSPNLRPTTVVAPTPVPVATPPTPPPKRKVSYQELVEILERDDICELLKVDASYEDQVKALVNAHDVIRAAPDEDSLLMASYAVGPQHGIENADTNSLVVEFFNALLIGDLIDGVKAPPPNYEEADRRLQIIGEQDPDNAAIPYLRASLYESLSRSREEIKALFASAFSKPRFEKYEFTLLRRMLEKGFANSAYFVAASAMASSSPIVNVAKSYKLLMTFVKENDQQFNAQVDTFGHLLMSAGQNNRGKNEMYLWSALDYSFGRSLSLAVTHDNPASIDSLKQLMDQSKQYDDPWVGEEDCAQPRFKNYVDERRRDYLNNLKD